MSKSNFKPYHINASAVDLEGNDGIGRYVFLPGSDGRAKEIANQFDDLVIKTHSRGHHLYLGSIHHHGKKIDVASISSGMGCPSMEIILHELIHLGAKRFLRVGTAGSLQTSKIKIGSLVNAKACVRDENTTLAYTPIEFPAVAASQFVAAIESAANHLNLDETFFSGIVHCKSSFYAREFGAGPQTNPNNDYLNLLIKCGVLATEMESSTLFIQSHLYDYELQKLGEGPRYRVSAGAILGILSLPPHVFATENETFDVTENLIKLSFETIKQLTDIDMK